MSSSVVSLTDVLATVPVSASDELATQAMTDAYQLVVPSTAASDFAPVQAALTERMPAFAHVLDTLQSDTSSSTSCPTFDLTAGFTATGLFGSSSGYEIDWCSAPWASMVADVRAFLTVSVVVLAASWQLSWWRSLFAAKEAG